MIERRAFLRLGAVGGLALMFQGHAPYRQWVEYRKDHLMIVASKQQADAFPLALQLSEDLAQAVPAAQPRAARAPTVRHITRLINSRQIDVAVLTEAEAVQLARGEGEASEGPLPIRVVAFLQPPYVLVCHAEFERDGAYLLAFGLFDETGSSALAPGELTFPNMMRRTLHLGIPLHAGAREFYLEQASAVAAPPS